MSEGITYFRATTKRDLNIKNKHMKNTAKITTFNSITEEKAFWEKTDSADFVDWSTSKAVNVPHLKPTLKSISLRLPEMVIEELKILANKRDVPYQSLLKQFVCERLAQELKFSAVNAAKIEPDQVVRLSK
jgi:predicted DNA binding CopG/RHH family protein